MAGPFYVDDGGNGADGLTWTKAYTTLVALDTAVALASSEIIYIGHNSVDAGYGASKTITLPADDPPVIIISATQGSDPPTYAAATASQISAADGNYVLTFDGACACYGLQIAAGSTLYLNPEVSETQ